MTPLILDTHQDKLKVTEDTPPIFVFNPEQTDEHDPKNYTEKVTFSNYKPDPDNNGIVILTSSFEEAEEFGAMPVSDKELNEFLGIGGLKDV